MKDNSGDRGWLRHCFAAYLSLVIMTSLAASCSGGNEPAANETSTSQAIPDTAPPQPLPVVTVAPVSRVELLAAAAAAADEAAGGNPLPKANLQLTDRTFELRLPFGCSGGTSADWWKWSIDPKTRVLRISVRPQVWGHDQTIDALAAGASYDAAEGFWIERPWTRSETCPPSVSSGPAPAPPVGDKQPTATPETPPMRTFAIIQFFSPDAPRTLRRGSRPYSYTGKVSETEAVGAKGFRLKVTGRIRGFGDGQPIHCVLATASKPPICAAAVEFTQVVLEDADTGESLAEWNS